MKKLSMLVYVVMAAVSLARAGEEKVLALDSLNQMAGGAGVEAVKAQAGVSVGAAVEQQKAVPPSRSYRSRTVNDDGSISIVAPLFMLNGDLFPIAYYQSNNTGVCALYGLGASRFANKKKDYNAKFAVRIDENGKVSRIIENDSIYESIVCEAR